MIAASVLQSFSDEIIKISEDQEAKKDIDIDAIKRKVELWSRLHSSSDVPINVDHDAQEYGGGYYDMGTKSIGLSQKDPESLAHELGHAELHGSLLGRLIQNPVHNALFPWTPVAGALAGVLLAKGKKMGALLPIATAAPTLLAEWLATRKGANRLQDIGATPEEIAAYRKNLASSFSTYHGVIPQALMAGGAGYVAGSSGG